MAKNLGMIQVKTAEEVTQEANEAANAQNKVQFEVITSLAGLVDKKWEDAKEAKETVECQMLDSMKQRRGEYKTDKLADIQKAEQPEIFMNITETKCRNAIAWVKDILIIPNDRIFGVDPTPIPELPPHIVQRIQEEVLQRYVQMAAMQAAQTGVMPTKELLQSAIMQQADEVIEATHREVVNTAKKLSEDISQKIDDDFVEGGFYKALNEAIDDIVSLKAGIVKGPVFEKIKVRTTTMDETGRLSRGVEERIVPVYKRRSPFCIYPSPRSTGVQNGYLFDVISLKPSTLYNLIGVEGFNAKEIRDVLREFRKGELKNDWLDLSEEAKEGMGEERTDDALSQYPEENIYCLELWDEIEGGLLNEWGLNVEDEDAMYPCCIWKIGNHIIKAMLNYDVLGRKPFAKTSFQKLNDSFWGLDVPELIEDCQQVCNACARNILANIGIGALPMIGLNVDRLEPGASKKIWPGKIWEFTEEQIASGVPPIIFYQPQMVTEKLMNVYSVFSKIADEHSGVPAYAHGDSQVGGAGNTASGLSMLVNQASRGIKAVVRNIDEDIISPCAEYHYDYLLDNFEIYGLFGDYKINAKGSAALLAKEQQSTRKIEYLQQTANPVDIQLVGMENRRKMLLDVAKNLGIPMDETVFPALPPPPNQQAPPQEAPVTLDAAGNPAQGTETREFNPPGQLPGREKGGKVEAGKAYIVGEKRPEVFVPEQDGKIIPKVELRKDGTPKGTGFLGVQKMTDGSGRDMTEYSIGVNFGNGEIEIPTLVPTLTDDELNHLRSGGKVTPEIDRKAREHAIERIRKGRSPFIEEGEQTYKKPNVGRMEQWERDFLKLTGAPPKAVGVNSEEDAYMYYQRIMEEQGK